MYSDLTSTPVPDNLPNTRYDLTNENDTVNPNSIFGVSLVAFAYIIKLVGYFGIHNRFYRNIANVRFQIGSFARIHNILANLSDSIPIECEVQPTFKYHFYDNMETCKTSKRLVIVHYDSPDIDGDESYSSHPIAMAFTNRTLFRSTSQSEVLTNFQFWYSYGRYFFTDEYIKLIGSLVESGIQSLLERKYSFSAIYHDLEKFYKKTGMRTSNKLLNDFVNEYMDKLSKVELVRGLSIHTPQVEEEFRERGAEVQEFQMIFILFSFFTIACVFVFLVEYEI